MYKRPDGMYFLDEWFDVVRCDECGLGFVSPMPSADEISKFYPEGFYNWFRDENHIERYNIQYKYLPDSKSYSTKPVLLDIGCGVGDFPRYVSTYNWQVEGVEPYCQFPIDDFTVYREPFEVVKGLTNRFDAITAWAVFEHLRDPKSYFKIVADALKPNGKFVFLVTNFESISSRHLYHEDAPRHLHFFTKKTVSKYLQEVGMTIESATFDDNIFSMGSRGALNYLFTRYILKRPYLWEDRPMAYPDFLSEEKLDRNLYSAIKFIILHPITCLDRLFEPILDHWLKMTNNYGIVTYVAKKTPLES
jgi:SAM-dependent methyltransferase